ncbi:MAG: hypothetical protein GY710_26485 [Desulfobacteraceae bacterium]|nr:hypothetical protein [Desulfobacteraceae bacterium]
MQTQINLITGADLQELKDLLGVTLLDLIWVCGIKSFSSPKGKWKISGERSDLPILQPSLTILIRYLKKYPEESMLPAMPAFMDVYDKVEPFFDDLSLGRFGVERMGPLLGVGYGAPVEWKKGMKKPALAVQRLLYVINQAVTKRGIKGFKEYLEIVEMEAFHRENISLLKLLEKGTWSPRKFINKYKDPSVPVPEELITNADLQEIQELLNLSWWDFIWLMGRAVFFSNWKTKGDDAFRPQSRPTTCILARYLKEYNKENFIPQPPDHTEIYELIKKEKLFKRISSRKVGPLFGVSGWSFNQYKKGAKKSTPMVRHLFYILKNLIQKDGQKGFDKYFEVVNEEILARNLGSYDFVIQKGWGSRAFKEKCYPGS